jgi:hypothetical protein
MTKLTGCGVILFEQTYDFERDLLCEDNLVVAASGISVLRDRIPNERIPEQVAESTRSSNISIPQSH